VLHGVLLARSKREGLWSNGCPGPTEWRTHCPLKRGGGASPAESGPGKVPHMGTSRALLRYPTKVGKMGGKRRKKTEEKTHAPGGRIGETFWSWKEEKNPPGTTIQPKRNRHPKKLLPRSFSMTSWRPQNKERVGKKPPQYERAW